VLQQRSLAALILALISLVGLVMANDNIRRGIVVLAVALVIGGGGLWLSTTAMSRAKKARTTRPRFSVLATVLAIAGTGLSALALLGFALFWPQISQYSKCMSGANTVIAQDACNKQLTNSLPTNVHLPGH
jgi:ABC-type amino acid transport system permease subunit